MSAAMQMSDFATKVLNAAKNRPQTTADNVTLPPVNAFQSPSALALGSLKARKKQLRAQAKTISHPNAFDDELDDPIVHRIVYQSRVKMPKMLEVSGTKERWKHALARTTAAALDQRARGGRKASYNHSVPRATTAAMPRNAEARARCAESLYKLSKQPGSELMIIKSGAIQTIADFCDADDIKLQEFCAATLANLTTRPGDLSEFVHHDGIAVVLELSWSPSFYVKFLAATTLCRLSCYKQFIPHLMASKSVIEISTMLALPYPPLQQLCINTLINMISFGSNFHEKLYTGGGSNAHNKLGMVLSMTQLIQDPMQCAFIAKVVYILSIHVGSASGAIRGGVGDLISLIVAKQTSDTQSKISILMAKALGNYSRLIELQTLLGIGALKTVYLLLSHYEAAREAHRVILHSCSRIISNMSCNEEYMMLYILPSSVEFITRVIDMYFWSQDVSLDDPSCIENTVRTIANATGYLRCAATFCVQARLTLIVQGILAMSLDTLMEQCLKEDILVAVINLACHDIKFPLETIIPNNFAKDMETAFSVTKSSRLKLVISMCICYFTFHSRLRPICLPPNEFILETLLYGVRESNKWFDHDEIDALQNQERFIAAICFISNDITDIKQVYTLIEIVLQCLDTSLQLRPSPNGSGATHLKHITSFANSNNSNNNNSNNNNNLSYITTNFILPNNTSLTEIEYYAAGIIFYLSQQALRFQTVRKEQEIDVAPNNNATNTSSNEFSTAIFTTRVQDTLYRLSQSISSNASIATLNSSKSSTSSSMLQFKGTQSFCTGSYYNMCACGFTNAHAIKVLIEACYNSEDSATLLACAATFAIVSYTQVGRSILLDAYGLAHALNKLGRTSSADCQQYAAIAACNVAIVGCIWNFEELKDFVVVALLRSNSYDAKQIHAKTLYNVLSHSISRSQVIDDGVLYAFLKLAQLQTNTTNGDAKYYPDETLSLCIQALFNLSDTVTYHDTILKLGVPQFLLANATSNTGQLNGENSDSGGQVAAASNTYRKRIVHFLSVESRRYAAALMCNLSSREENHKELINAQVTDVIKLLCDRDTEAKASGAMILRNLTFRIQCAELVCTRISLNILINFMTTCTNDSVRILAAQAIGNCSLVSELLHLFHELNVSNAVLKLLEMQPVKEATVAGLRTLHNLALDDTLAIQLVENKCISRLVPLLNSKVLAPLQDGCLLAATLCRILSSKKHCTHYLAQQEVILFVARLTSDRYNNTNASEGTNDQNEKQLALTIECLHALVWVSTHPMVHQILFEHNIIATVSSIFNSPIAAKSTKVCEYAAIIYRNLSLSTSTWDLTKGLTSVTLLLPTFAPDGSILIEKIPPHLMIHPVTPSQYQSHSEYADQDRNNANDGSTDPNNLHVITEDDATAGSNNKVAKSPKHKSPKGKKNTKQPVEKEFCENVLACTKFLEDGGVKLLQRIADDSLHLPNVLMEVSIALANLSKIKRLRKDLIEFGVIKTLLLMHGTRIESIQEVCTVTLHRLAAEHNATMEVGLIEALLSIIKHNDKVFQRVQHEEDKVNHILHTKSDEPLVVTELLCKQSYRVVQWVNYVVEAPVPEKMMNIVPKPLEIKKIRGLLPATNDVSTSVPCLARNSPRRRRSSAHAALASHTSFAEMVPVAVEPAIIWIDSDKVILEQDHKHHDTNLTNVTNKLDTQIGPESDLTNLDNIKPEGEQLQLRKFDRQMKLTRETSRKYAVSPNSSSALLPML